MANKLVNLWADSGADIIDDGSDAVLALENKGAGNALALKTASGTGVALDVSSTPTTGLFVKGGSAAGPIAYLQSGAAGANALRLDNVGTVLANPSAAQLLMVNSTASGVYFDFQGAVISTASINLAANQTAGFVRARIVGTGGEALGFIPIFKGVA